MLGCVVEVHGQILQLVRYPDLLAAGCCGCSQQPEVWVPVESPKEFVMEGSSIIKREKIK